jgi:hypothetical protein
VNGTQSTTGKVVLSSFATAPRTVALRSESNLASVPASVPVGFGKRFATFPIMTSGGAGSVTTVRVVATQGTVTASADLCIGPSGGLPGILLDAQPESKCVLLRWNPLEPEVLGRTLKGYQVVRRVIGGSETVLNAPNHFGESGEYLDTTGTPGTNYEYQVRLVDSVGLTRTASGWEAVPFPSGTTLSWALLPIVESQVVRGTIATSGTLPFGTFFPTDFERVELDTRVNMAMDRPPLRVSHHCRTFQTALPLSHC